MVRSKDSFMRYGAMFAIGCAYAGTNNNQAVKKLLHYAVSDVSDDVKRAALMNLGFLLFRKYEKIPELVK
jgi:26S proteasome regulatory subunit N2